MGSRPDVAARDNDAAGGCIVRHEFRQADFGLVERRKLLSRLFRSGGVFLDALAAQIGISHRSSVAAALGAWHRGIGTRTACPRNVGSGKFRSSFFVSGFALRNHSFLIWNRDVS